MFDGVEMKTIEDVKNKRILIMGGVGFIGHNLALKIADLGGDVTVVDGLQVNSLGYYTSQYSSNTNSELYISIINERLRLLKKAKVKILINDIRDYHTVSKIISEEKPDTVVHLAAIAHANRSNKDPFSTFDHSMRTLENVLDAIRNLGVHLIFFSSSMVYGNFNNVAVKEDAYCNPIGIYGALKYGAEKLVIAYNQVFDLPYTIIRPSALYGERCVSRRVGQAFIENALKGENLTINGDGSDALDFTYIEDLVKGVILSIVNEKSINQIFNLTYGQAQKINEMADIVKSHFSGINIIYNPRDNLMPERGTLSIDKAKKLIGYNPTNSLSIGFENYIEWYKNFAKSYPEFFETKR